LSGTGRQRHAAGLERNDVRFATTVEAHLGKIRWMTVAIGGKLFHVNRQFEIHSQPFGDEAQFEEAIDKLLVKEMEHMLTRHLTAAAAAIADGPLET
jgi:hypothetical protein